MPRLSRVMLRCALVYLWLGFGLGSLLMVWKGQPDWVPDGVGGWLWLHVDWLLMGWMVQLAMGVAYWIFPRLPQTRTRRGRLGLAVGAGVLLNSGVALYTVGVLGRWGVAQTLGLLLQVLAVMAFMGHIAPRIRPTFTQQAKSARRV